MSLTLPALPFKPDALEPYISARTLQFHYEKHHNAYVTNGNKLLAGSDLENRDIESIILESSKNPSQTGIFNNAAQTWNHTFYWNCLSPNGGGEPGGEIARMIKRDFEGFDNFVDLFKTAAATLFGSGWAWLVLNKGKLEIMKGSNADLPIVHHKKALLTIDVWEHAYYLDYQNRRPEYIATFLEKLVNWDFVNSNL